jgi:uncharacterized protein (DUF433 family)
MNESLIVCDPAVMMGKPVVAGTRITVELILEKLANGESVEQIVQAHPRLTAQSVLAAIDYAKRVLNSDEVYPVVLQADESVDGPRLGWL